MNTKYRYLIMSMVVFITIINYIDRGALSYAQAEIIKEFHLDPQSWGAILGYFGYGYIFGALFGGMLADKKGPKYVWILAATTWSLFEIGTIFAGEIGAAMFGGSVLAGFAVFRVLFGLAEGPTFSTINRTVANWVSPKEKGFATAFGLMGSPLGALITAPVIVELLSLSNWRVAFIILGVIGFVWAAIWSKFFTNLPEENPYVSKQELAEIRNTEGLIQGEARLIETKKEFVPWYSFFKNKTLVMNAVGYFAFMYVNFLLLTWTPKYLQDMFHFKLTSLWYLGMIPWIGACITALLGGKISDLLRNKTGNLRVARSGLAVVSLLLTAVCFMLIPIMNSVEAILFLIALGNAFNFLPSCIYWTVIIDTEPSKAGTFGGVTHFIANLATIIAPTLTGFLVASYGYTSMFIAAAIAVVLGMVAMLFVKPGQADHNNDSLKSCRLPFKQI